MTMSGPINLLEVKDWPVSAVWRGRKTHFQFYGQPVEVLAPFGDDSARVRFGDGAVRICQLDRVRCPDGRRLVIPSFAGSRGLLHRSVPLLEQKRDKGEIVGEGLSFSDPAQGLDPDAESFESRADLAEVMINLLLWITAPNRPGGIAVRALLLCSALKIGKRAGWTGQELADFASKSQVIGRAGVSCAAADMEKAFGLKACSSRADDTKEACRAAAHKRQGTKIPSGGKSDAMLVQASKLRTWLQGLAGLSNAEFSALGGLHAQLDRLRKKEAA